MTRLPPVKSQTLCKKNLARHLRHGACSLLSLPFFLGSRREELRS